MSIEKLKQLFEENKNSENAYKMKSYLRNKFEFLGISKPERSKLEKEFIKLNKQKDVNEIIVIVEQLHNMQYREYMYTAQQLLMTQYKNLSPKNVDEIMKLTLINSWWENTDGYMAIIKRWLEFNPQYIKQFVKKYYKRKNFWLRRMAIIAQLSLKTNTDFAVLQEAILYNIADQEFFIQKAIGWALRDYSKSNPKEVKEFIECNKNEMSNLAIKEASKYL